MVSTAVLLFLPLLASPALSHPLLSSAKGAVGEDPEVHYDPVSVHCVWVCLLADCMHAELSSIVHPSSLWRGIVD